MGEELWHYFNNITIMSNLPNHIKDYVIRYKNNVLDNFINSLDDHQKAQFCANACCANILNSEIDDLDDFLDICISHAEGLPDEQVVLIKDIAEHVRVNWENDDL